MKLQFDEWASGLSLMCPATPLFNLYESRLQFCQTPADRVAGEEKDDAALELRPPMAPQPKVLLRRPQSARTVLSSATSP